MTVSSTAVTHRGKTSLTAVITAAFAFGCSSESFDTRPVYLVSHDSRVDTELAHARQAAADEDWNAAAVILSRILREHPGDPLALVAGILQARITLARGDVDAAARTAIDVTPGRDPALDLQRDLLLGLVAARRGDTQHGLALLRPLAGRMIDRTHAIEVDCGLAALDAADGPSGAARALTDLAQVDSLANDGLSWLPTGLACDLPTTRSEAMLHALARVTTPETLAAVLDTLSSTSPLRRAVAERLRTVAVALHQVDRWRASLADLPPSEATLLPVRVDTGPRLLRIGVLVPVSGSRAGIGITIVREVQLALEGAQATDVVVADEGSTPAQTASAYQRLASAHVAAIIGPSQEESARALVSRTDLAGVPMYLLAPFADARETQTVHLAGPSLLSRTTQIAAYVRSGTVSLVTPQGDNDGEFVTRLRGSLTLLGVTVRTGGTTSERRVAAGPFGTEALRTMALSSGHSPLSWIYDARASQPGALGVWVGLHGGPDFDNHLTRYCALAGEAPGELGMLAYDAARAALASARGGSGTNVLARGWEVSVTVVTADGEGTLAATARCPTPTTPTTGS